MKDVPVLELQRSWSESAIISLRRMFPLMAPLMQHNWTPAERETLAMIAGATARSSESTLLLCSYGQVWDAEMTLRSVFEGTLKFSYLLESKEQFQERHLEYSEQLFNVALLKDHQKAVETLAALDDSDDIALRPIRDCVLPEEQLRSLQERYGRETRRKLEQKWGFTSLIVSLRNQPLFKTGLAGIARGYSFMSHLQHADYVGVVMPHERSARDPARKNAIELAHTSRILADTLSAMIIRLSSAHFFVGADKSLIKTALDEFDAFGQNIDGVYETWSNIEYGANEDPK